VILLARHGQTAYNAEGRFQGHLPVPLNALGRDQAATLAQAAAPLGVAELWCSPLERARETAEVVGAQIGLDPVQDARFAETDCGDWTDRWFAEVQREDPERFARFVAGDPGFAFPGGESFAQQTQRVAAGLEALRAQEATPILVVCHGVTIRLALAHATDTDPREVAPVGNAEVVELP